MLKTFLIIALFWHTPLFAKTYALLVGINKYEYLDDLKGSVNDVDDIEQALLNIGVSANHIIRLTDAAATKKAIKSNWEQLIRRSAPGDSLLLSYSGHGTQEFDVNGDEKRYDPNDTLDETRLLGGFNELTANQHQQRIVDDELYKWFQQAQGRRVIYIADSCHSGKSYRNYDSRSTVPIARFQQLSRTKLAPTADSIATSSNAPEAELENFIFFSASDDNKKAYEYIIDGRYRGALSWAFSRAIQFADIDEKGLSLAKLSLYIRNKVKQLSNNSQFPNVAPRGNQDLLVFEQGYKTLAMPAIKTASHVNLGIRGALPQASLHRTKIVPDSEADIIWDVERSEVIVGGDISAFQINNLAAMQKVIDRWFLIQKLTQMSETHAMESQLGAGNQHAKLHNFGDVVKLSITSAPYFDDLLQFNIAGNGEIECYPRDIAGKKEYSFEAQAPAGNDSLISIAINRPSSALLELLKTCPAAADFEVKLPSLLEGYNYQMNRVDLFTGQQ